MERIPMRQLAIRGVLVSAAVLLLSAGSASAQPAAGPHGPCKGDVERLCSGVEQGHGAVARCLQSKRDQLSPACRARLEAMENRFQKHAERLQEACAGDVDRLCTDAEPGAGGRVRCLRDHESDLSAECQAALPPPRASRPAPATP
jgi:Cysteine rich repeat